MRKFRHALLPRPIKLFAAIALTGLFLCGCGKGGSGQKTVDKIKIIKGEFLCAPVNSACGEEVIIELLGETTPGFFGGKGAAPPVAGVGVKFTAPENSGLSIVPGTDLGFVSDAGGVVRAIIHTGDKVGRFTINGNAGEASTKITVISGLMVSGGGLQTPAGEKQEKPIRVTIADKQGPLTGVPVEFSLASSPERKKVKAKVSPSTVLTDENGVAATKFTAGTQTGEYKIGVTVADPERGLFLGHIVVPEMVLNWPAMIFTVLGGLAIFIFGMKLMSEGLQLVAGAKMKAILQFFTRNRFIAVAAGALVTGVIQSSSACTVMVVGFVNAGLLSLAQAIGVVFGANIGTTITAQLISFKLGALALPAIILGVATMLLVKKPIIRGWAQTIFGFGLLFFGMSMMGDELKLIKNFPSFISFFKSFDCTPIDGVMPLGAVLGAIAIGTAMTVIIQSSSATIGIAMALAASGLVNFYTVVPLILGDNIGTTITAVLASLGANKRAKQTAVAHVLFNTLGAVYMVILFYLPYPSTGRPVFLEFINMITAGDVFAGIPENIARHIAMAHTLFNVFNVLLFIPFIVPIAKLCEIIIPVAEGVKIESRPLEPHLLDTPSVAIEQTIGALRHMTKDAWQMIVMAVEDAFMSMTLKDNLVREIDEREDKIDSIQEEVTDYMAQLAARPLTSFQSGIIPHLMHCVNDAERIADHAKNILTLVKRMKKREGDFSGKGWNEIEEMWQTLRSQAAHVISCLENTDNKDADMALKNEKILNKMAKRFEKQHIKRLERGDCDAVCGVIFIEMLTEIERIGDKFSNIAERAPEIHRHHIQLTG